jgi:galactitol-specific phosphotransferase system IIB component
MKITKEQIKQIIKEELQKENENMAMHQHDANSTKAMQDKAIAIIMAMNVSELVELLKSDTMNSVFQRVMSAGQY